MPHPFGEDIELRRRILTFLSEQTLPRIVRLTMPLFVPDDRGKAQLVASSVILRIGPARVLVTATHVVNDWPGIAINVGDALLQVRGQHATIYTNGTRAGSPEDKLDLSLIRLDPALAERILPFNVTSLADLDLTTPVVGQDPFVLGGYPERRNRDGLKGEQFTAHAYALLMHDGEQALYDAIGADSASQLALPFERNDVWEIERQVTAPNLEGISGGGLWRVPIDEAPARETRLAAIAVEQHQKGGNRHVLATRIRKVLSTLHQLYGDLRQPLEAEYRDIVA